VSYLFPNTKTTAGVEEQKCIPERKGSPEARPEMAFVSQLDPG
jgi:hypothetical protein